MTGRSLAVLCLLVLPLLAAAPRVEAQLNCRVSVVPLNFGVYLPGDASPLDVTGDIDVSCRGQVGFFLATIGPGSGGSFANRQMLSGPYAMRYNLYRDAGRSLIWGDGTGGSVLNGGIKWRNGREDFLLPVYGRVLPRQSVGAGTYQDNVLVTIIF
jgi:spore coat protein U-like protein